MPGPRCNINCPPISDVTVVNDLHKLRDKQVHHEKFYIHIFTIYKFINLYIFITSYIYIHIQILYSYTVYSFYIHIYVYINEHKIIFLWIITNNKAIPLNPNNSLDFSLFGFLCYVILEALEYFFVTFIAVIFWDIFLWGRKVSTYIWPYTSIGQTWKRHIYLTRVLLHFEVCYLWFFLSS